MKAHSPNFFVSQGRPLLENDQEEYIEEYINYIRLVIRKNGYLKSYFEDIEQSIILELLRTYPKKYKYNDFDFVTKTIIRRRVIDYRSNFIKKSNEMVLESDSTHVNYGSRGEDSADNCYHFIEKSLELFSSNETSNKIIDLIKHIQHGINTNPKVSALFNDFDRQFIEVVLELYEYGHEVTREDLMSCMGYEASQSSKFNSKLNNFRNKIQKNFKEEDDDQP